MSTIPLPERPNIEHLKNQARDVQKTFGIKLTEAQLHVARGYGFASWPKLKKHIEIVTQYTRTPDLIPPSADPIDEFLRSVCLNYGNTDRTDLAPQPTEAIATANVWAAAATGSYKALLDGFKGEAARVGGPFEWEPLMYLCYSRVAMTEMDAVVSARLLLKEGADPNAGYLWHGYPTPFTALTGVFGNGEGSQPSHPHADALARVLLMHGADPNDSQTLYNRQFKAGVEHLELLFEFGLGQGDGGPWKQRLTSALSTPSEMLRDQLRWAVHHDMRDRVRLLAENGVDLLSPFDNPFFDHCHGRTPAQWAALCGNDVIVRTLVAHGCDATPRDEVDDFIGAVMAGRYREDLEEIDVAPVALRQRPSLLVQAVATKRKATFQAALRAEIDLNALGRADSPCEQPWQTALHTAVEHRQGETIEFLLKLGADPTVTDARFNATPRGWAEHFGFSDMAALLP